MIRVAVEGASGYVGSELVGLLQHHPEVELVAATAGESAGRSLGALRPRLRGASVELAPSLTPETLESLDLLFLALPHGESTERVPRLPPGLPIIDLSAAFRGGELGFVYGLPELQRGRIREAGRVAAPGCFATAACLALLPALEADVAAAPPVVSAITGSSGSGHRVKATTHHPERALNFFAYQPLAHRHQPEIENALAAHNRRSYPLTLQVHSAPLVRGIYASAFFPVEPSVDLAAIYRARYQNEPFVSVGDEPPELVEVAGTPFAAIAVAQRGAQAVVFCAIDNLLKGAASQAVQCMNLLFRLPEDAGLRWPAGALP